LLTNYKSPAQNEIASTDLEEILFHPPEVQQLTAVTQHLPQPSNNTHQGMLQITGCYYYYYKNKNWLQFLFIVKAAVLKQQISKFYPQIQRTEASEITFISVSGLS